MNVKLPDDQTLWFRNLPPKASDGGLKKCRVTQEKNLKLSCLLNL